MEKFFCNGEYLAEGGTTTVPFDFEAPSHEELDSELHERLVALAGESAESLKFSATELARLGRLMTLTLTLSLTTGGNAVGFALVVIRPVAESDGFELGDG